MDMWGLMSMVMHHFFGHYFSDRRGMMEPVTLVIIVISEKVQIEKKGTIGPKYESKHGAGCRPTNICPL